MQGRRIGLLLITAVLLILMSVSPQAQQSAPTAVPGFYAGLDSNNAALRRGEAIFYRDCSLCHLPRIRKARTTPGPGTALAGVLKGADKEKEGKAREFIMNGSDRMPGWQYSLKPAEIDDLITYLKTL